MRHFGKLLILLALGFAVAGTLTSATWLLVVALVLSAIFIGAWGMSELRQDDPWRNHKKRASSGGR